MDKAATKHAYGAGMCTGDGGTAEEAPPVHVQQEAYARCYAALDQHVVEVTLETHR